MDRDPVPLAANVIINNVSLRGGQLVKAVELVQELMAAPHNQKFLLIFCKMGELRSVSVPGANFEKLYYTIDKTPFSPYNVYSENKLHDACQTK